MRLFTVFFVSLFFSVTVYAAGPINIKYNRGELETRWQARIQSMLDQGKLPKIDMQTSFKTEHVTDYFPAVFETMDDLGVALFVADGYQRPKDGSGGYRWGYDIRDLVNTYPDHIVPTANGGTNKNWLKEKGGAPKHFIDQMVKHVRAGVYAHMGELDFRHYMSSSQCKAGRLERNNDILLNGENGQRVFELSEETGVPFTIHLEPENEPLDALEEMLAAHPKAKVMVAHFTQIRHPEKQKRFTPDYVRKLLSTYPNLYYDLSSGQPNRKYKCAGPDNNGVLVGDTLLWRGGDGNQVDELKSEWKAILTDFSDRFVFATDYGGGRAPLPGFLAKKVDNFNSIVRELPEEAKHNIAYRNGWKLLTGKNWK